ncbi:PASTA domain-containing protein [Nocardioides ochotonae]|uniref:PASTA domain-containing protein n=1 Tax=Nocardioides ochotonae TaxID=2685869 RepID=UPI001408FA6A|nr:PASTA domain-containing protein [Nocardioides ochotonae]
MEHDGDFAAARRPVRRAFVAALVAGVIGASLLVGCGGDADPATGGVEGMRAVGVGGAAIAVPSDWRSNHVSCGTPLSDTYYSPVSRDCKSGTTPLVSSVAMATELPEELAGPDLLSPAGEIRGHEIRVSAAVCFQSDPGVCAQTFAVPDLDAYFHVTVRSTDGGEELVRTIRESLRVLEPDQRVVPFMAAESQTEVVSALEAAGLAVQIDRTTCPPTARCGPGVTRMDPPSGSVVPAGSSIVVRVVEPSSTRELRG